jgi:hypothetical protein
MLVTGLDGKEYRLSVIGGKGAKSGLHKTALEIVKKVFPGDTILNEISLPGAGNKLTKTLYADIMLPARKLVVEVHGEQHYKLVPFFHGSKREFLIAQSRDQRKREWCELNNFTLIELPFNQKDNWEKAINAYYS